MTVEPRPKRFPPPAFPPRQPALFARTPPAIFSPILGLLGLALAVRLALGQLTLDRGPGDLLAGIAVALWGFAAFAYGAKVFRRPGVVVEDLRVLPGRAGLAALTVGGMATAALVAPYAPVLAKGLIVLTLVGHAVTALLLLWLLGRLPPEARRVNPTLHLSFVGFIVAAPGAVAVGWTGLASGILWLCLPVALAIWGLSALQFAREVPPPPLRPLLAIHVAPAALMATVAGSLGLVWLSEALLLAALLLALALALGLRWLTMAGISPIWAAFTFPLAALALALIRGGGLWQPIGLGVLVVALGVVPTILWWVLKRWPGGRLAALTNAAEA
ncbi:MAG: tellurium resistance protein [Tabrizicola sp.]|nr:tellurium resistance protein [Tabrizicola sp.]